jgi:ribosomal-protein-alanine N-acetyltransferase
MIVTRRLTLVPASVALARAELDDRAAFADLLGAVVPEAWPPPTTIDALPLFLSWLEAAPDRVGWFAWYALLRDASDSGSILVGGGGFLGPPEDGTVQLGYSILSEFQRRGYATEMVRGLATWAFVQPSVAVIAAETEWANPASVRVLERAGFHAAGTASHPEGTRFELHATPSLTLSRAGA